MAQWYIQWHNDINAKSAMQLTSYRTIRQNYNRTFAMTRKIKLAICLAASFALYAALFDGAFVHFTSAQTRRIDFRRDIEPILRSNCYQCHGANKASAQLRLDEKELAMKGGISGSVIIPGN